MIVIEIHQRSLRLRGNKGIKPIVTVQKKHISDLAKVLDLYQIGCLWCKLLGAGAAVFGTLPLPGN